MSQANEHDEQEAEANLFARCLLMPDELVHKEIRAFKHFDLCNDDHIKALARKFQVSQGMMAFRIGELRGDARPV